MWEAVIINLVSEQFDSPDVVGAVMTIRPKEDSIQETYSRIGLLRSQGNLHSYWTIPVVQPAAAGTGH